MVKKVFLFFLCLCFCDVAICDVCSEYKKDVDMKLTKADWKYDVTSSDKDLWPVGGYVKVQPFYTIEPNIGYMFNGKYYCVFLESVESSFGFHDFEIVIDERYKKDSCEYNAVLEHEKHHMTDAENALENVLPDIEKALQQAADSVEPIYASDAEEVPYAFEKIQKQLIEYKKLKKLIEKFKEQQSKDAEILDEKPDEKLQKCEEDKLKKAFENYYKKDKK